MCFFNIFENVYYKEIDKLWKYKVVNYCNVNKYLFLCYSK